MKSLILFFHILALPLWADIQTSTRDENLNIDWLGSGSCTVTQQISEQLPLDVKKRLWQRLSLAAEQAGLKSLSFTPLAPPAPPSFVLKLEFAHINDLQDFTTKFTASREPNNPADSVIYSIIDQYISTNTWDFHSLTHINIHRSVATSADKSTNLSFRLESDIPGINGDGKLQEDLSWKWGNTETIGINIPWYIFIPRWFMGIIGGILTGSILAFAFIWIKRKIKKRQGTVTK